MNDKAELFFHVMFLAESKFDLAVELRNEMANTASVKLGEPFADVVGAAGSMLFASGILSLVHYGKVSKAEAKSELGKFIDSLNDSIDYIKLSDECADGESMFGQPTCM